MIYFGGGISRRRLMAAHNDTGDVTLAHNDSSVTANHGERNEKSKILVQLYVELYLETQSRKGVTFSKSGQTLALICQS